MRVDPPGLLRADQGRGSTAATPIWSPSSTHDQRQRSTVGRPRRRWRSACSRRSTAAIRAGAPALFEPSYTDVLRDNPLRRRGGSRLRRTRAVAAGRIRSRARDRARHRSRRHPSRPRLPRGPTSGSRSPSRCARSTPSWPIRGPTRPTPPRPDGAACATARSTSSRPATGSRASSWPRHSSRPPPT